MALEVRKDTLLEEVRLKVTGEGAAPPTLPSPATSIQFKISFGTHSIQLFADSSFLLSNVAQINLGSLANWLSVLISPHLWDYGTIKWNQTTLAAFSSSTELIAKQKKGVPYHWQCYVSHLWASCFYLSNHQLSALAGKSINFIVLSKRKKKKENIKAPVLLIEIDIQEKGCKGSLCQEQAAQN